ncbi:hypothetical protein [Pragia fontium]|uniref:hypothetical protein n=1 Tax=Pragia fontium TaxID=82985 RepID=UPI000649E80B|nr:hypothetical protein [Pragia fontium]AKJ41529.1 hypothetical protein QQ39_05065 [Pragia fontium]
MLDIYHALTRHDFKGCSEDELKSHITASEEAHNGIMNGLCVIGHLSVVAASTDDYEATDAKHDLFHLGSALMQLTRVAEAINHNQSCAEYELHQRQKMLKKTDGEMR